MKKIFPTKKITTAANVTSRTLKRYVKAGLIDAPVFKSHGRKGASLYWPASILYDLVLIKNLKAIGKSMAEIRAIKGESKKC